MPAAPRSQPGVRRTVDEWERRIGEQVRDLRLRQPVSQAELARLVGVSPRTIQNLEAGNGSSLSTLVGVCRALGRTDWLETLAPPATISPMQVRRERVAADRARRQRAPRISR